MVTTGGPGAGPAAVDLKGRGFLGAFDLAAYLLGVLWWIIAAACLLGVQAWLGRKAPHRVSGFVSRARTLQSWTGGTVLTCWPSSPPWGPTTQWPAASSSGACDDWAEPAAAATTSGPTSASGGGGRVGMITTRSATVRLLRVTGRPRRAVCRWATRASRTSTAPATTAMAPDPAAT